MRYKCFLYLVKNFVSGTKKDRESDEKVVEIYLTICLMKTMTGEKHSQSTKPFDIKVNYTWLSSSAYLAVAGGLMNGTNSRVRLERIIMKCTKNKDGVVG